jgi:hypothetical protein
MFRLAHVHLLRQDVYDTFVTVSVNRAEILQVTRGCAGILQLPV